MIRRSLAATSIILGLLVVWLPAFGLVVRGFASGEPSAFEGALLNDPLELSLRTLVWSIGVAVGAVALGWIPGRMLGACMHSNRSRGLSGSFRRYVLLALILLPLLVPSYALFYAWWQTWPSGSWLFGWLESMDAIGLGRQVTLGVALVSWSWPLVSLCVAPAAATWPSVRTDQLRSDGAGHWQRIWARWHHERGGLLLGLLLVAVLVFGNIISFDLAGVFTVGNELRSLTAVNAPVSAMFWLILPAAIMACIGAVVAWWALGRPVDDASPGDHRIGIGPVAFMSCVCALTTLLPNLLVFLNLDRGFPLLWQAHGPALLRDTARCFLVGLLVALVYLGLIGLLRSQRRAVRAMVGALSITWIICLFVPGSLVATAVIAAVNICPGAGFRIWLLGSGVALQMAWLAKFGGLAALGARWVVSSEPAALRDLSRMQSGTWLADGPRTWLVALGIGAIGTLLAMGEIPVSMRLSPPSVSPPVSVTLLNAMHYQRPETVIAVLALLLISGWIVAIGLAVIGRVLRGFRIQSMLCLALMLIPPMLVPGCSETSPETDRLNVHSIVGGPGRSEGSFDYPRAMAVDQRSGDIYTVEKSGRVQHLDAKGRPLNSWQMPRIERGRPTGISVAPDGTVWVADTHEHRIMIYDRNGTLIRSFGEYGTGDGEFIYPTDIAFGPDDLVYVSEYGGNDRIQVFDADGSWVRAIGGPGSQPGQFDRPQSLAISNDGEELFVADARNRRIQRVHLPSSAIEVVHQGGIDQIVQVPFGIDVSPLGQLIVSDTGSHRIIWLEPSGAVVGHAGGWGWGDGQLRDPWAVSWIDGAFLTLDSGNNRILKIVPDQGGR